MRDQSSGGQADRIWAEIAALASLGIRDLKSRWRAWYDRTACADQPRVAHFGDRVPHAGERVRWSGAGDAPTARRRRRRPLLSPAGCSGS